MKTHSSLKLSLLLGVASLSFLGCSDRKKDQASSIVADVKDTAVAAYDKSKDATTDAWNELAASTYAERQSFKSGIDHLAAKIDAETNNLADHSAELSDDARESWSVGMENLKQARAELAAELNDLGEATAENWDEAKHQVVIAWAKVETAYQNLEQKMTS